MAEKDWILPSPLCLGGRARAGQDPSFTVWTGRQRMREGSGKDGDRRGRKRGDRLEGCLGYCGQAKEAGCERGRPGDSARRQGRDTEADSPADRRGGRAGGGQWRRRWRGALGEYGRGRGGERSCIRKGKGGDVPVAMSSKRRLPLHYGTPTKPGTPHIRARLFSQSIYSPRPPPPPTATYASNPAEHLQLAGHAISYAMAA